MYSYDALYFNDAQCPAPRAVKLRNRLVERVVALNRWK